MLSSYLFHKPATLPLCVAALSFQAGLCHSAYSNSYVNLKIFDSSNDADKAQVVAALGAEAEATIRLWCTIDRRKEARAYKLGLGVSEL